MSEIVHILGDLSGLATELDAWRRSKVDKKTVGKLTRHLGPLQGPTTVAAALDAVEHVAGPGGKVILDEEQGTLRVRAVVTDHQLHDLAAPLIGAFRGAGARGARGSLWLVEGATDAPGFGHRLDVDDTGATIRALARRELALVLEHPGRLEVVALEEALAADASRDGPPGATAEGRPASLREVPLEQRPIYEAAWDLVATADEAVVLAAIARASAWVHPQHTLDPDLARLGAARTRAEALEVIGAHDPGRHRGRLDVLFHLLPWIDATRAVDVVGRARAKGTWPFFLANAIAGLLASGIASAAAEAWAVFEAACDDKETTLSLWDSRNAATNAIARSTTTEELVSRLDVALKKKTQLAAQKRAIGLCLALARRGGEDAHAAIDRAAAAVPEKAQRCIVHYAAMNGWSPAPRMGSPST